MFIDVSGAVIANDIQVEALDRLITGISLLGCEPIVTGISARIARALLKSDTKIIERIRVESTLQEVTRRR